MSKNVLVYIVGIIFFFNGVIEVLFISWELKKLWDEWVKEYILDCDYNWEWNKKVYGVVGVMVESVGCGVLG